MRVLMAPADIEQFGRLIHEARPTARFIDEGHPAAVLAAMPPDRGLFVDIHDATISPGLGLPAPVLGGDPNGMLIRLHVPHIRGDRMAEGDASTVFNPADPEHVSFTDAVFRAVIQVTKPHVTFLDGTKVPVRVGPAAEAWWCEDKERYFAGQREWVRYRLAKPCPAAEPPGD
jgi:hypothetical protein